MPKHFRYRLRDLTVREPFHEAQWDIDRLLIVRGGFRERISHPNSDTLIQSVRYDRRFDIINEAVVDLIL